MKRALAGVLSSRWGRGWSVIMASSYRRRIWVRTRAVPFTTSVTAPRSRLHSSTRTTRAMPQGCRRATSVSSQAR